METDRQTEQDAEGEQDKLTSKAFQSNQNPVSLLGSAMELA